MKTEHWLTIVLIISSFIAQLAGPGLAEFVKSRISQPKPIPQPNQPKNRTQRIAGSVARFLESLWWIVGWPLVFIPFNIYELLKELHRTTPVTRGSVFLISTTVASTVFLCLNMFVLLMQRQINSSRELIGKQAATVTIILDLIEAVQRGMKLQDDRIELLTKASEPIQLPTKAGPDKWTRALSKLLDAVKNLLGR